MNMSPSSHFFERVKFSLTHPELVYLSLKGKRINFRGIATMSYINIQRRSEMLMFFSNNRLETEGQHNKFLLYLTYI